MSPSSPQIPHAPLFPRLAVLLGVHVLAAVVATRVIARRIEAAHPARRDLRSRSPAAASTSTTSAGHGTVAKAPAILLLHGATSNARDMVVALAGPALRASSGHRHRSAGPWLERPPRTDSADASPARQADLIAEALRAPRRRSGRRRRPLLGRGAVATNLALDHARPCRRPRSPLRRHPSLARGHRLVLSRSPQRRSSAGFSSTPS